MNFQFHLTLRVDDLDGSLFQYLYSHGDINFPDSINIFINENAHGTDPNVLRTVVRDTNDSLNNFALQVDISDPGFLGQWHTYTLTVGANGLQVFIDGNLEAADTTRGTGTINPSGNAYLGVRQDDLVSADRKFGGSLDSVQIYDNALSNSKIADIAAKVNHATVNITVNAVNDNPVIAFVGGNINYIENATAVFIDPAATVTDSDNMDFDGGVLSISVPTNGSGDDRIRINNEGMGVDQVGMTSGPNELYYSGVLIGTWSGSGAPLAITFNAAADVTAVEAVAQNITFENLSDNPSTATRNSSIHAN